MIHDYSNIYSYEDSYDKEKDYDEDDHAGGKIVGTISIS